MKRKHLIPLFSFLLVSIATFCLFTIGESQKQSTSEKLIISLGVSSFVMGFLDLFTGFILSFTSKKYVSRQMMRTSIPFLLVGFGLLFYWYKNVQWF